MGTKRTKASCGTVALDSGSVVGKKTAFLYCLSVLLERKLRECLTTGNKFYVIASCKNLMWQGPFLNNLLV